MSDDIDEVIVRVRADTAAFARDVATMRGELEGPLATGVARAGRVIEGALTRAISSGKFGFDDLKRVALRALGEIAAASLRSLLAPAGQSGGGNLGSAVASLVTGLLGAPGRAAGGPVSTGRAYLVGERGPELFVPSGDGRIVAGGAGRRDVRIAIAIQTPATGDPQVLQKSGRQIARAVRSALGETR
jgi:hypothetical protein